MKKFSLIGLLLCFTLTGCFRPGSQTQALRDSILKTSRQPWEEKFEFGLGRLTLALGKIGLRHCDLEPDAKIALSTLHAADVSIYKLDHSPAHPANSAAIMTAADRAMEQEGWDRLVGVRHDHQMVGIYVPRKMNSTRNVKVCLFVLNERNFVCASASSDLEPLLALAMNHADLASLSRQSLSF